MNEISGITARGRCDLRPKRMLLTNSIQFDGVYATYCIPWKLIPSFPTGFMSEGKDQMDWTIPLRDRQPSCD